MNKFSFSGHESFVCKQFWLKKAFDFSRQGKPFADETAVVDLGVGKNMVTSLRFWSKAFGVLTDNDQPTELGEYLFGKKGKDPYLEDLGTIWLLHYSLVKTGRSSIYNLVFNGFRKGRMEFTKEQLHAYLKNRCEETDGKAYNPNTIDTDILVFLRNYLKPEKGQGEVEDNFSGILMDTDMLKHYRQRDLDGKLNDWYKLEGEDRIDLPYQIVLYAILDNYGNQKSITFRELHSGVNSPGAVFALNAEGLYSKLQQIVGHYPEVIYTETAGNQLLQFKSELNPKDILHDYYS